MNVLGTFQFNILALFLSFVALQGFFLFFILVTEKRGNAGLNRILAALVLTLSLLLTDHAFSLIGLFERLPHLLYLITPLWYLLPALFYFYVRAQVTGKSSFSAKALLHFAPLVFAWLNYLPFYLGPAEMKLAILAGVFTQSAPSFWAKLFSVFSSYFYIVQLAVYLFACNRMLRRHETQYKQSRSNPAVGVQIEWLKHAFTVFGFYAAYELLACVYLAYDFKVFAEVVFLSLSILSAFIFLIAYNSIRQPEKLFAAALAPGEAPAVTHTGNFPEPFDVTAENGNAKAKYQHYAELPPDMSQTLAALRRVMEQRRLYRNSELKLADLSSTLSLSTHQLSQLLNQELGLSFYDFVNQYRVKEAQARLADPASRHLTILSIALDAGFNSQASFYRIFKKSTGMTPTAFIQTRPTEKRPELTAA